MNPGIWRRYRFRAYGVAFPRQYMLDRGANQVWYINSYVGDGFRWLAHDINELIDDIVVVAEGSPDPEEFNSSWIARLTPYIEVMGKWATTYGTERHKDFTFEREWRYAGDFRFTLDAVAALIVPPGMAENVREALVNVGVKGAWAASVEVVELDDEVGLTE